MAYHPSQETNREQKKRRKIAARLAAAIKNVDSIYNEAFDYVECETSEKILQAQDLLERVKELLDAR